MEKQAEVLEKVRKSLGNFGTEGMGLGTLHSATGMTDLIPNVVHSIARASSLSCL